MPPLFPPPVLAQEAALPAFLQGSTRVFDVSVPLPPWAVIAALAAVGALFHYGLRSLLHRWAKRTSTELDDIVVGVANSVVPVWVVLGILYVAIEMLPAGKDGAHTRAQEMGDRGVTALVILSLFWALGALLLRFLRQWSQRNAAYRPVYPPIRFVLRAVLLVVAGVTVLAYLKVDISALLGALGVGGLAVALALKDTLENFFAGLHIMADRPLMEGDVVIIQETGEKGVVQKVGWRSTRILNYDNNVVVYPNTKLASGIITNFSDRDPRVNAKIEVGVSYDSDPDRVRTVLLDELGQAVDHVPGLLKDPAPVVWLHPGFGASSLDFTVRFTVAAPDKAFDAQDILRRRIFHRLRKEGIGIPFPTRTLDIRSMPEVRKPPAER